MLISRFFGARRPTSQLSPSKKCFSLELGDGSLHTIGVDMEFSMIRQPKDRWVYQVAPPFFDAMTVDSQRYS